VVTQAIPDDDQPIPPPADADVHPLNQNLVTIGYTAANSP